MTAERPYSGCHPVALARLGSALLATCWTLALVRWTPSIDRALQAWARRVLAGLGIQVVLAGPIPEGGQLWVSNHLSWLDPLVYLSLRPCRILAKTEVAGYPGIGAGARRIGLRFVRRESLFSRASALRTLGQDLRTGEAVLVFPEGTTTQGLTLAPLHEGSLRMAFRLDVKVLPIRLSSPDRQYPWVGDASLVPHLLTLTRSRGTQVVVHPGALLESERHADEGSWIAAIRGQLQPTLPHEVHP